MLVKRLDVWLIDRGALIVHFLDVGQEGLLGGGYGCGLVIREDSIDDAAIAQQFRRNCGVTPDSERALIQLRSEGGDQLPEAGTQGRRPAHDGLGEGGEVRSEFRLVGKQMHDLRNGGSRTVHGVDCRIPVALDIF